MPASEELTNRIWEALYNEGIRLLKKKIFNSICVDRNMSVCAITIKMLAAGNKQGAWLLSII